jgi:hypothetical protein
MEQSEGFKSVYSKIKSLEQQLSLCDKTIKDFEQSGKDAEQDIEEHFAMCMNSLAARKAVLLKEVSHKITNQSILYILFFSLCNHPLYSQFTTEKIIEDSQAKLEASIELCKQTLKTGSMSYAISPSIIDAMWKVVHLLFFLAVLSIIVFFLPQTLKVLPVPQVLPVRVTTKLPNSLLKVIQNHGEGFYPA